MRSFPAWVNYLHEVICEVIYLHEVTSLITQDLPVEMEVEIAMFNILEGQPLDEEKIERKHVDS